VECGRGYYIGLGYALVIATSVAFRLPLILWPSTIIGGVYFFLLFSLDPWLISDQTAGSLRGRPGARAWRPAGSDNSSASS
jgi:hypothetical protein